VARTLIGLIAAAMLAVPGSASAIVWFEPGSFATHDIVVNPGDATVDAADAPNGNAFGTQAAIEAAACGTPHGLPDDGVFAADANHPAAKLWYGMDPNGPDAHLGSGTLTIPNARYEKIVVFTAGTNGGANAELTVQGTTGQVSTVFPVPDWLSSPPTFSGSFALVDGLDRSDVGGTCDDLDTVGVWGHPLFTTMTGAFDSVIVTSSASGDQRVWIVGAVGVAQRLDVTIDGGGTVTSFPAAIACPPTCTKVYDFDSTLQVGLAPNPAAGKVFSGWSGACSGAGACTVNTAVDNAVTAKFVDAPPAPPGGGGGTTTPPTTVSNPPPATGGSAPQATPPARDRTPPRLRTTLRRSHSRSRGVRGTLTCSERCTVIARLMLPSRTARKLGLSRNRTIVLGTATVRTAANKSASFRVRVGSEYLRKLRRQRRVGASLQLTATDAARNASQTTHNVVLTT
jgi:hypothetical protein